MVLTPSYHVFRMYKGHQNAKQLETYAETKNVGIGGDQVPNLHVSASQAADGSVLLTVANLSDTEAAPVEVLWSGIGRRGKVEGTVLAGAAGAYNTFDAPANVKPAAMDGIQVTDSGFTAVMPACSVAAFTIAE